MAVHLRWSPLAESDLLEITAYIQSDNPAAATSFAMTLIERTELLRDFPEMGRIIQNATILPFEKSFIATIALFIVSPPNNRRSKSFVFGMGRAALPSFREASFPVGGGACSEIDLVNFDTPL